jgi:hypothetical protein
MTLPTLTYLINDVLLDSFCPEGFIDIGVPIDTDAFVQSFVAKTCRDIIDDVEKLDTIQDAFIHYQLFRFFQDTRLQYINSHIMLPNRSVLQQQHVDCKVADTLLKKGTKQYEDGWDSSIKDWTHMCIHLPHPEGDFGVTLNDVTKDAAFYTTTSRFVVWFGVFTQIHSKLLTQYDCKEVCTPSQSQVNVGTGAGPNSQSQVNREGGPRPSSQDGVSQFQDPVPLSLPQLNRLVEVSFVWDERSVSNADVTVIPSQVRVTQQILNHW